MYRLKRIRIVGNVLMLTGFMAFGLEFLSDLNYLPLSSFLGVSFTCGFGGLGVFVLGAGIAEWARQGIEQLVRLKPLSSSTNS